ncbi:MAG: efflux transporter outer membrane subunit [Deltaproteobacteria bacterium]|jgi:multidrug efflux system outer membrane protein|nr:efflux transporter outer membrane subunit [Deltaproteobacteria bacterium]
MPRVLPALFSLLLAACSLAPAYHRPDAPIPAVYPQGGLSEASSPADLPDWSEFFKDPVMRRLIDAALIHNRDLRIALLNIELTRAMYRVQRADLLPGINAAGQENSQLTPANLSPGGVRGISRQYSASLGFASFELDLFGRIRNLTEQALETFHSVENDAQTAQLSLVAEVAAVYLQLVADRELYAITLRTHETRKAQHLLVQDKFAAGVASELEAQQARGIMEEARSNAARYAARVGQDLNALTLLLGSALPADLPEIQRLGEVVPLPDVPEGLPSGLLERRPDIQAAEHLLKGYNANIGAARANFFPSISLTGSLGSLSAEFGDLFTSGQHTWNFLPQITLPIFDFGRNLARLDAAEAQRDMAVAVYEKTIQTAFREVSDALVQRAYMTEQLDADSSMVDAARRGYDLARQRYDVGVDSYLNVLNAEQMLYSARQSLVGSLLLRESNALALYTALGGGWR